MTLRDRAAFSSCEHKTVVLETNPQQEFEAVAWVNCPRKIEPHRFESNSEKPRLEVLKLAKWTLSKELACGDCVYRLNGQ